MPRSAFLTDVGAEILHFAANAFDGGFGAALATLVDIRGGSARSLGAHMAIRSDGKYCGFVSGGCTESAVAAEAVAAIRSGHDRYLMLGAGSPFFDIVLPCGGGITIAIHILRDTSALHSTLASIAARLPAGLLYRPEKQQLTAYPNCRVTGWESGAFATRYRPRTRVFLFGRSIELETTEGIARAAGYEVACHNPDDPLTGSSMDDATAVALLYHDIDREIPVLEAALRSKAFYLGALGSQQTHEKRKQRLLSLGFCEADLARIKAPIGIFSKARTAQALAFSVLAEISQSEIQRLDADQDSAAGR